MRVQRDIVRLLKFDTIHDPLHHGYRRNTMDGNPDIEWVSDPRDADYIYYCAWGDGPDVLLDMDRARELGPCVFHLTGDECYVKDDEHIYFTTHLLKDAACKQFQVPYAYPSRRHSHGGDKRKWSISFQGSFTTNPDREALRFIHLKNASFFISEAECWSASDGDKPRLWAQHHDLLMSSYFTLCPRGKGPTSIRVTEAMLRGSIPILLDDNCRYFEHDMNFCLRPSYKEIDQVCLNILSMPKEVYGILITRMADFIDNHLLIDKKNGFETELGHSTYILSKLHGPADPRKED